MTTFYVYQLRRSDCVLPFYIGKGKGNRMYNHFVASSLKHKSVKNNMIRKAALDGVAILCEKLQVDLDEFSALALEVKLIEQYGRRDSGTGILANMTNGGEGVSGLIPTTEARKNMSEAGKRRPVRVPPADCVKEKISATLKGRPIPEEVRLARLGKITAEDTKAKMSAAHKALPKGACIHCGKEMFLGRLKRFHNDNCKTKPTKEKLWQLHQ